MEQTRYGLKRVVDLSYDEALQKTREALKEQGFGILTEIDLKEKLKEKLGVDFKRYMILGACNPPLAHQSLQVEADIGLLLPCNVIVYEEEQNRSVVAALDPGSMVEITGNAALGAISAEARGRLEKALSAI
jgi:uncharacterized protein (DUF302 family)